MVAYSPPEPRDFGDQRDVDGDEGARVNVSIPDEWCWEFMQDRVNGFVFCNKEVTEHKFQQDQKAPQNPHDLREKVVIPLYCGQLVQWLSIIRNNMRDISPAFNSNRLARAGDERLYLGSKE